jgi:hypothetical protein
MAGKRGRRGVPAPMEADSHLRSFVFAALAFSTGLFQGLAPAPERSPLWARLQTAVSSRHSAPGSPVEAVVTRDYASPGGFTIPMGSRLTGAVREASTEHRAALRLSFDAVAIEGRKFPLEARILEVDNARERVTPDGTILPLEPLRSRPGKLELVLLAAAHAHPALLVSLETTKYLIREAERPEVEYPAGTDIGLNIEELPALEPPGLAAPERKPAPPAALAALFGELPDRTHTRYPPVPSDWINLAFLGSRQELARAFEAADWSTADQLCVRTEARTFFAVMEHHAYQRAPVSALLVWDREPDLVYQKQTNTFAKRHHIRLWSTDRLWKGRMVWIAAATHDIGIDFSREARTFTHRVASDVDLERLKVVDDLRFAGQAGSVWYLSRPSVPAQSSNATGDVTRTDGRLAVLEISAQP